MVEEFSTFEDYALVLKKSLEKICHDDNMAKEDEVQIIYADPPVAFARFQQITQNGQKPGPLISFNLESIDIDNSDQLGGWKSFVSSSGTIVKAPVIAKLKYKATINAIKESQADLLSSQIMLAMPFNRPYATMLDGQWVTMISSDFASETNLEINDGEDKIVKRTCVIEIPRAYFNHPIQVNSNYIKKINAHIYSVDENLGVINENN